MSLKVVICNSWLQLEVLPGYISATLQDQGCKMDWFKIREPDHVHQQDLYESITKGAVLWASEWNLVECGLGFVNILCQPLTQVLDPPHWGSQFSDCVSLKACGNTSLTFASVRWCTFLEPSAARRPWRLDCTWPSFSPCKITWNGIPAETNCCWARVAIQIALGLGARPLITTATWSGDTVRIAWHGSRRPDIKLCERWKGLL